VQVNGRVSPLLELGAGFHPELSGRANILLNGVLLGLKRDEVLALEQEIIEFSELGDFIDMPVRTYSSGMYAKLGFSIVTTLKPDILLLDEVLAVGDIAFQHKCKAVFENFRNNPEVTMILVSHSLDSVTEFCSRVAWIEDKKVMMVGDSKEVARAYTETNGGVVHNSEGTHAGTPEKLAKSSRVVQGARRIHTSGNRPVKDGGAPTVIFNTYPTAYDVIGGGEVQLMAYLHELTKFDFRTKLFDQWSPRLATADIVHFFSIMPGSAFFCEYVSSQGIPLFLSPNTWVDEASMDRMSIELHKTQLGVADKIICNSMIEVENYSRIFGIQKEKFLVVPCGIDNIFTQNVVPDLFRKKNKDLGKFILNVGTLEERKNHMGLIRAMKAFPEYALVLIGHVRDQHYAQMCFEEGGSQLLYMGPYLHEDPMLRSAMAACDVFVGSGLTETPGGANLEAAAQGAPMAVTEGGSTREYFQDMVAYFDPRDTESMIDAIAQTMRQGPNGALCSHIRANYQWQTVLKPLADAYHHALEHSRA
jgi:ABC-type multidrug transport system ATPase subunit